MEKRERERDIKKVLPAEWWAGCVSVSVCVLACVCVHLCVGILRSRTDISSVCVCMC